MTAHVSWEMMNDLLDGRLDSASESSVREHLDRCAECSRQLGALTELLNKAHQAPEAIEAPAHAWTAIRRTIEVNKNVSFPNLPRAGNGIRVTRTGLIAAAAILMTASSALTVLVMRSRSVETDAARDVAGSRAATSSVREVSDIATFEQEYIATAKELRSSLDAERPRLAPATIATVERSLHVIDEAIAEAREALLQDPANSDLRDVLRNNYQQKIDFLRRATAWVQKA